MGRLQVRVLLAAVGGLVLGASCGGTSQQVRKSEEFEVIRESDYRVAVLPFHVSAAGESFLTDGLADLGGLIALEGLSDDAPALERAGTVMRRAFVAGIAGGSFQVADLWQTDTLLAHRDLMHRRPPDPEQIALVARTLGVDGLVYGDVFAWNRSYYVLQSTQEVGLRIELIDGRTGESHYWAEHLTSGAAGVTGGPTGQVSALTEPLAGLAGSKLSQLARSVARNAAMGFAGVMPETELNPAAAMGDVPRLSLVSVARNREDAYGEGDEILVVALGSANADVRFHIGRYRTGVPMVQVSSDSNQRGERGKYIGRYVIQKGDRLGPTPVFVSIRSRDRARGPRTVRRVVEPLVEIDATRSTASTVTGPESILREESQ